MDKETVVACAVGVAIGSVIGLVGITIKSALKKKDEKIRLKALQAVELNCDITFRELIKGLSCKGLNDMRIETELYITDDYDCWSRANTITVEQIVHRTTRRNK